MRLSSVDNWNFRFHSPATVLREEGKGLEMKNSFHRQLLCPISPHDDSSQTIKFVIMERAGKMKRFSCFENSFTEISFARLVYDRKSFLRGQLFIYVSAFHSTSFLWKFSRISRHLQGEITSSWLRIRKLCEAHGAKHHRDGISSQVAHESESSGTLSLAHCNDPSWRQFINRKLLFLNFC